MGISAPRADSFEIIDLQPVKQLTGINPMVLSASWDDSINNVSLKPVLKN